MATLTFQIGNLTDLRKYAYQTAFAANEAAYKAKSKKSNTDKYLGLLTPSEVLTLEEMLLVNKKSTPYGSADRNVIMFKFEDITAELTGAKISVTRKNTIVSTALTGRTGTVKEYIRGEDYQISITGELINTNASKPTAYPVEQLKVLVKLLAVEDQVQISSAYLNIFDISTVVLKSCLFNQSSKYVNTQPFKFEFLSDNDVDLYSIEDE